MRDPIYPYFFPAVSLTHKDGTARKRGQGQNQIIYGGIVGILMFGSADIIEKHQTGVLVPGTVLLNIATAQACNVGKAEGVASHTTARVVRPTAKAKGGARTTAGFFMRQQVEKFD